ncbi:hypothetical protein [Homoserinimonas hongtaonis]|uniref:FABP family protein n=1 Tax=Homoserinimonas hongtaonis TaxID=2079791 RepID=A0A2U1SZ43_9MICO|nr:hypothetical protein [Salinibacterium hongtaonis]AWB89428.1 hypothetical protein C2138_07645 [Salinibacterium hongtaonis]PWB96879.1 hypothetical protein DF220_02800 [Salinibacterium hongtaonis]
MPTNPSVHQLAESLPGSWRLEASNVPFWTRGRATGPRYHYGVASANPLVISETIEFDAADGRHRLIKGKSRFVRGEFVWRGEGLRKPVATRWSVAGTSPERGLLVVRFAKTVVMAAGLNVLVRDDVETLEARSAVANHAGQLGISLEEFATLNWNL